MKHFQIGSGYYLLDHIVDDDSRDVIRIGDPKRTPLLRFDSSLRVRDQAGKVIGCVSQTGSGSEATFTFDKLNGEVVNLGIALNDWHWTSIVDAEVAVARHVLAESV